MEIFLSVPVIENVLVRYKCNVVVSGLCVCILHPWLSTLFTLPIQCAYMQRACPVTVKNDSIHSAALFLFHGPMCMCASVYFCLPPFLLKDKKRCSYKDVRKRCAQKHSPLASVSMLSIIIFQPRLYQMLIALCYQLYNMPLAGNVYVLNLDGQKKCCLC